ncbi:MAG: hypothetical protein EP340_06825 [Alphaproteobacteria bacterium]|nr:MAG: hypothetical protein EP340_06825 [Alphaproteobacteria bacterium]
MTIFGGKLGKTCLRHVDCNSSNNPVSAANLSHFGAILKLEERIFGMAFLDKQKTKRKMINSELMVALAFNLGAWLVAAVIAFAAIH